LSPLGFSQVFGSKAVTHNFDINFCTQQYVGPEYLSKEHAEMNILTQYLEQEYLHPEIREKGGAYGARASVRECGNISLYSYMDPEASKTFKVFDESVERVKSLDRIPEDKLTEIKITLLGEM
jgi:Zn-dependent M16 (insulinase) family peptidase